MSLSLCGSELLSVQNARVEDDKELLRVKSLSTGIRGAVNHEASRYSARANLVKLGRCTFSDRALPGTA